MKPRLKTSPAARELIKRFEPFRAEAVQDADGRWVVGYGHRAAAKAGVRVSEDEAALLLIYDVMRAEEIVDDSITGPLSRGQRDALTSFVHDVGVDRFRGSDVARYLFEGRARAAGEALAAYGDGTSARREAESTLFLDALLPADPARTRRSEPVELVIKIEHPSEARVLEGAIAGDVPPPPEAYSDLPPPPPPPDAGLARRREAEDEIARILAAVEALPPEVRQDAGDAVMAPMADAVSDMRDDPIDATYHAVEAEDESPETPDAETPAEPAAALDPEAAADRVLARMDEEIGEGAPTTEAPIDTPAEAVVEPDPVAAAAPTTTHAEDTPAVQPAVSAPIGAFDLPAGTGLGFVLASPTAPAEDAHAETASDDVPAEDTPAVDAVVETPAEAPVAPQVVPDRFQMELPEGTELGYALTGVMQGRFRPQDDTPPAQPAPAPEATPVEPVEVEAEVETGTEVAEAAEAEAEIIERTVSLSGDDTPPPHPAETPAAASGAVGEVVGEKRDRTPQPDEDGRLDEDPLMAGPDPLADDADDFSPRDLAADVHAVVDEPGPRTDDGLWTFLAVLVAGGLLAGFGTFLAAAEWDYIVAQREMTLNFGMALAGFFLVIVAGWQLASIWLSKLKQKAGN